MGKKGPFRDSKPEQNVPPMVGSLFSWKSLLTNRRTSDDCVPEVACQSHVRIRKSIVKGYVLELRCASSPCVQREMSHTFPTAASPSKTSLTLLLGLGADESAMAVYVHSVSGPADTMSDWKELERLRSLVGGKVSARSGCVKMWKV